MNLTSKNDEARRLHGTARRGGHELVTLSIGDRVRRVVQRAPRMDLQIAAWQEHHPRAYDDIALDDGQRLTVYRDLHNNGWYLA